MDLLGKFERQVIGIQRTSFYLIFTEDSPDHELKLLMGACPTLRQQNQTCSTFKAGSSQISDLRINSPSYRDPGSIRNLTSPNEVS
ncbi:uncharacterized protein DC041_0003574 [Schistosoma bovis]|uniref:Uncharacterized protein n=1 Tax=Schistosoma bovis TaxID=6184 RepID=A0A430PYA5_SCHBO|nr:uncharacterized protein DC041_0003574 [Schistosoma bovis]